ncbi:MAG TPA: ATP-binding cassette domain-containing protein [Acidimicrobiales bacterium]
MRTGSERAHPNGTYAIEAVGLTKAFGETRAVDGIDLAVKPGTVFGVLGPNGAGKTTTLRMLATLLKPDAGTARIFGHDVVTEADAVRGSVSLTGQFASVDEELTGRENLLLIGRLLGFSHKEADRRATELLEAFGLADAAGKFVRDYSGGMRRRLDIAASIVVTPPLLFLDEPTTGLDPRSRNQVWDIVRVMVAEGTTVLLTTQYLDEADQLADRIAIIGHGNVIAEGTSGELKALVNGSGTLHVRVLDPAQREEAGRILSEALGEPFQLEPDPAGLSARVPEPEKAAAALAELARCCVPLAEFSLGQPSLDEVFLALTGHPAEPTAADAGETDGAGGATGTGPSGAAEDMTPEETHA